MARDSFTLSGSNLLTFLTCRRRFQLRVLEHLAWPDLTLDIKQQAAVYQGQYFHRILERHFLGLPVIESEIPNKQLLNWWQQFEQHGPTIPEGRRLPEIRLTVPVGSHYLVGRFDLVVIETHAGGPRAHIFDWKTSRPRSISELQSDWQTRLYLAMMAESGQALIENGRLLEADQITLTYWYTNDPDLPPQITYSQKQHEQNWNEICAIVDDIEDCLQQSQWPLTANWSHCRKCAYQAYCGRWEAGQHESMIAEERAVYDYTLDTLLEPGTP